MLGDEALGVLTVSDHSDGRAFGERDLRMALRLAQDLATALGRVRRFEASEDNHDRFVRTLAHELRNPLDGVLRFINLSLTDQHPEERRRRYLMASKQGLERLTGIVESLSGFYLPDGFKDVAAYIVVLVMLVVMPNGLFGEKLRKKV